MRCPRCQHENPADVRFCGECGARLDVGCPACGAGNPSTNKFCHGCGGPLIAAADTPKFGSPDFYTPPHLVRKILISRSALEGERKLVSVLFCDLVSSSELAERLGPEGMHALLNSFFETALAEVHRYEGTVNQFLGDGFMALFGAPLAHEDHARRAVLAALGLRDSVAERPPSIGPGRSVPVMLRLGIHTGFVVVGAIGDNLRMDYTAIGDTTHLAARLQQMAVPGSIVISEATATLARGYVRLETLGLVNVRGRSAPVRVHVVTGHGPKRSSPEGVDQRPRSHFIGRDHDLRTLSELFAEVQGGHGRAVGIEGEPGVGKSRLLFEFRRTLTSHKLTYLEGRCQSFGRAIPFLPLLDVLRAICGIADEDPPETVVKKVQTAVGEAGIDVAASTSLVLHLLGTKDASGRSADRLAGLDPEAIKARIFGTLRRLTHYACRDGPVIVAIEDLQWIDGTSAEYLSFLVESLPTVPIMLLVTYRSGYRPGWLIQPYATELSLTRLTPADSLAMVRSAVPEAGLADPLAKLVLDKAEGNPFFLEELCRAVNEQGLSNPGLTIPDTVHGVLTARIDRLGELPKRLLQTACVLGREFSVRLLETVWGAGPLDTHLLELTRQEFLVERSGREEAIYVFKHALTQDVAEATILAPRRRQLHHQAGQALEALYPDRLAELAPMLAHHYYQAQAWPLACEYATRAATAARAVYANQEALERYDQALAAGEHAGLDAMRLGKLHAERGQVHRVLGNFEPACADLDAALGLARSEGDAGTCAELLGMLGELWGGHRNYHRGLELTLEAVRTAEIAGNRQALAVALIRTGLMQLNLAQMSGSCRNLERALTIFQDLDDQPGCAKTLDLLAMADGIVGQIGRAIARNRDALRRYHALGDRMAPPSAITNMGVWLASAGKRREAEPFLREGLRTAIDLGARGDEAYACGITGWLLEIYGEYGPALRESTTALKLARQIGHLEWTAIALSVLGRITRICGQATRARQLHEDMLSITRELGTVIWIAVALAELGEDLIALGDDTRGFDLLVEAVSTAGEATEFVVRPLMAQAEWLLRQRRPEEALDVARQAKGAAGGYRVWAIEALKLEGEALVVIGRAEAGERLLRDAKAEARILTAAPPMWRAALSLADYLTRRGRFDEASAERADALAALESVAAGLPDDLAASFADSLPMHRASGTI